MEAGRNPEQEQIEPTSKYSEVYTLSFEASQQNGEQDLFHQSNQFNRSCIAAIDGAINENNYKLYHYNLPEAAKSVIAKYGKERVEWVLANIVQNQFYDGRYSNSNKAWAKGFNTPDDGKGYYLNSHATIVDGFINAVRKELLNNTVENSPQKDNLEPYSEECAIEFETGRMVTGKPSSPENFDGLETTLEDIEMEI